MLATGSVVDTPRRMVGAVTKKEVVGVISRYDDEKGFFRWLFGIDHSAITFIRGNGWFRGLEENYLLTQSDWYRLCILFYRQCDPFVSEDGTSLARQAVIPGHASYRALTRMMGLRGFSEESVFIINSMGCLPQDDFMKLVDSKVFSASMLERLRTEERPFLQVLNTLFHLLNDSGYLTPEIIVKVLDHKTVETLSSALETLQYLSRRGFLLFQSEESKIYVESILTNAYPHELYKIISLLDGGGLLSYERLYHMLQQADLPNVYLALSIAASCGPLTPEACSKILKFSTIANLVRAFTLLHLYKKLTLSIQNQLLAHTDLSNLVKVMECLNDLGELALPLHAPKKPQDKPEDASLASSTSAIGSVIKPGLDKEAHDKANDKYDKLLKAVLTHKDLARATEVLDELCRINRLEKEVDKKSHYKIIFLKQDLHDVLIILRAFAPDELPAETYKLLFKKSDLELRELAKVFVRLSKFSEIAVETKRQLIHHPNAASVNKVFDILESLRGLSLENCHSVIVNFRLKTVVLDPEFVPYRTLPNMLAVIRSSNPTAVIAAMKFFYPKPRAGILKDLSHAPRFFASSGLILSPENRKLLKDKPQAGNAFIILEKLKKCGALDEVTNKELATILRYERLDSLLETLCSQEALPEKLTADKGLSIYREILREEEASEDRRTEEAASSRTATVSGDDEAEREEAEEAEEADRSDSSRFEGQRRVIFA